MKYGCELYESLALHFCGQMIIDRIITGIQHNGAAIAEGDIFGYIRYVGFQRKPGVFRDNDFLP